MKAWMDGAFLDWVEAKAPILSHGFARGLAVFETVNILETPRGPAFFCLAEHIHRFFKSAELTYLDLPWSESELIGILRKTALENRVRSGAAKFFAFNPSVEFGPIPQSSGISLAVFCADYARLGFDPSRAGRPVTVGLSAFRKMHPETIPLQAKVTGAYVGAFLAGREVKARGWDYPLMCDVFGYVAEGAAHNVFFVQAGRIKTPTLERALHGTTRDVVLDAAQDLGIGFEEVDIRPEELPGFDEAFLTGSVARVMPIRAIDGRDLGRDCPGPITRRIMDLMDRIYSGEEEKYGKLFTPVE